MRDRNREGRGRLTQGFFQCRECSLTLAAYTQKIKAEQNDGDKKTIRFIILRSDRMSLARREERERERKKNRKMEHREPFFKTNVMETRQTRR